MPYCCNNALNMLRKCPNFTTHILLIIIIIILSFITAIVVDSLLCFLCQAFISAYDTTNCLMDSTFLRMLAVSSKTNFCKVPPLYDIPNIFKLHSKSFGMDPSAPKIIGTINVSLPHILAIYNRSSE